MLFYDTVCKVMYPMYFMYLNVSQCYTHISISPSNIHNSTTQYIFCYRLAMVSARSPSTFFVNAEVMTMKNTRNPSGIRRSPNARHGSGCQIGELLGYPDLEKGLNHLNLNLTIG